MLTATTPTTHTRALRYVGTTGNLAKVAKAIKPVAKSAGTLAEDTTGRRQFQRALRRAEMESIRSQLRRGAVR